MLSDALQADPGIELAGTAANGKIALAKIPQVNPDIVTLDLEMPEMNGLDTLRIMRKTYPSIRVIVFSSLTERGAAATLDALAMGAVDYVTKPTGSGCLSLALNRVRESLIPRIKSICGASLPGQEAEQSLSRLEPSRAAPRGPAKFGLTPMDRIARVVAVGASTGGPNVLSDILPRVPANFPAPLLIVQHMPPIFTKLFSERLSVLCAIKVKEAEANDKLEPGMAYLAPGDFHMAVERSNGVLRIRTSKGPPQNSCRPSADVLFASLAEVCGAETLAVVLTGMGQDGQRGAACIRGAGGRVIVQDKASSIVWGMPGAVVRAGHADLVATPDALLADILRNVRLAPASRPVSSAQAGRDNG